MPNQETIGWIATALSTVVFISPAPKLINVFKGSNSYEEIPTALFAMTYCNCYAWFIYGDLIESQQFKICNIIGWGFSLLFTFIYLAYEIKKFLFDPFINFFIIFIFTWAVYRGFCTFITFDDNFGKVCIGTFFISLNCPLRLIYKAVTEKNNKLISLKIAILTILSGICWTIYGFMGRNYYIVCTNLLSVFVAIAQIVVSKNYKTKYITIEQISDISTVGIESTGDDDSKKLDSGDSKINEEKVKDDKKIKAKPIKITTEKEFN